MTNLNQYIDLCLIDEYATKSSTEGYSLDVDSIPENDKENFLHILMQADTSVKDMVTHAMQKLINDRLADMEYEDWSSNKYGSRRVG